LYIWGNRVKGRIIQFLIHILFAIVLLSTFVVSKGVPAGTPIINVAKLSYVIDSVDYNTTSNTITDIVDQVLELEIVCQDSEHIIVQSGEVDRALTFRLTNLGNGTDNFTLTPDANRSVDFEVENSRFYMDTNHNGVFDVSNDQQITDVNLSADNNVTLFFVSDMPSMSYTSGSLSANGIEARSSISGSGTPGTFVDMGTYFAVDGVRGGIDSALCVYEMSATGIVLQKSATLSSDKLYKGSIIHYKIKANVEGTGEIQNVVIKDTIPQGTSYVVNSMSLNSANISDSGHISGTDIAVSVGNMSLSTEYTLEFDVKVN